MFCMQWSAQSSLLRNPFIGLLRGLSEIIYVKPLKQYLAHRKVLQNSGHHCHVAYNPVQLLKDWTLYLVIEPCWSWRSQGHDDISWEFPVWMSKSFVSQWGCFTLHSHHRTAVHLTPILHTDPNTLISKCRLSLQMGHHSQASDPCPLHSDMLNSHYFCCQNWTELRTVALAVSYHDFPRHCQRPKQWKQEERVPTAWLCICFCLYVYTWQQCTESYYVRSNCFTCILTHLTPTRALWGKYAYYYFTDKETRHKEAKWHAKSQGGNWRSMVCTHAVCFTGFCFSILKMYKNVSECMYIYHVYACACGRQKVPDLLKLELDR